MSGLDLDGYFSEVFSSIQGEGGSVRGSCFGKRQIFVRFAGCNLVEEDFGSKGCFWCDSPQAQALKPEIFQFEEIPGSQELSSLKNPTSNSKLADIIKKLITPDLHSISFTGGEPLYQLEILLDLLETLKNRDINHPLYLETNGSIKLDKSKFKALANSFKYCCCDIKDKYSNAASTDQWKSLVDTELAFIDKFLHLGVETFAKLVVTSKTETKDIQWICKRLSKIRYPDGEMIGLAIQPVTLEDQGLKNKFNVSRTHLYGIFQTAAEFLPPESLSLSVQAHKFLNIL